jgi:hypothetical protein
MVPRGSGRRVALVVVISGIVIVAATLLAYRRPSPVVGPANPATSTLTLALPGPFNGCSALSPQASATTAAVLDLIRPSAFLTSPTNLLTGEGGAIISAELVSLHPETVVYSIDPTMRWSNGRHFSVGDLITWWRSARRLPSVNGDGYRAIASMTIAKNTTSVTAVFSSDFADWNLLFRDVEQSGTTRSCAVSQLTSQPSLGPYTVRSATTSRIVLLSNPQWTINYNRFHQVIITSSSTLPSHGGAYFVKYDPVATKSLVENLVAHPRYFGQFGNSSDIVELTFSPRRALTQRLSTRVALSWLLRRHAILNQIFGSFTFTPSVPTSALFSQGQWDYPVAGPVTPPTSANATVVSPTEDCRACALALLTRRGYRHSPRGWRGPTGTVLHVSLVEGPSPLDRRTAALVAQQWTSQGVRVSLHRASSDAAAAAMSARGAVDAAIFARPTSTTPWISARSWDRTPFLDSYPSGVRSVTAQQLFTLAESTFNPTAAAVIWLQLDHLILTNFWVRPLYTIPSMTEWSGPVANVVASLSLSGLVDQVSNWGISLPSSTTTSITATSPVG